jgi:hypothetical protein
LGATPFPRRRRGGGQRGANIRRIHAEAGMSGPAACERDQLKCGPMEPRASLRQSLAEYSCKPDTGACGGEIRVHHPRPIAFPRHTESVPLSVLAEMAPAPASSKRRCSFRMNGGLA